ncbi:MAG: TrmB family transcriptional regulator sugar-binding domain-containing protein, partial [Candidatus Pacearchaeota archaeon]
LKGEEILTELSSLFTQGVKFVEPADLSGGVKGRQNVYNHLDMMIRDAEKTITIVTTATGLNRKMEALLPSLEKAKKRGVTIRIASQINEANKQIAKELSKVAEVRNMPKMRGRFAIVDSQQLLFMVLDDETVHPNYDVAVWLSTEFFALAMEQLFEAAWNTFKKI